MHRSFSDEGLFDRSAANLDRELSAENAAEHLKRKEQRSKGGYVFYLNNADSLH